MASSTQTTLKMHNWMRPENEELMSCYYAVCPSDRGFANVSLSYGTSEIAVTLSIHPFRSKNFVAFAIEA